LKKGVSADEILCCQGCLIFAWVSSGIYVVAVEPGFEGIGEDNLKVMGGVKRVHCSPDGAKQSTLPRLGDRIQALHEVDLSVIFQAYRAAWVIAVPNFPSRLCGGQAM
jgi:hypothetical protein